MEYLLFAAVAALSVIAIGIVGADKGVVEINKWNIYHPCEEQVTPYRGRLLTLLTIVCFAAAFAIQISLYKNTSLINFVKLYGVFVIVVTAGIIDAKRRIIPNILIIIGVLFRVCLYAYEIIAGLDLKAIFINDMTGFAIGFVFLALISVITKGSLGFGDAKLFGVIGLTCGSFCTYSTLLLSLIISVIVSVVGIARKKMGRKDAFPFGPCIAVGYAIAIFISSY